MLYNLDSYNAVSMTVSDIPIKFDMDELSLKMGFVPRAAYIQVFDHPIWFSFIGTPSPTNANLISQTGALKIYESEKDVRGFRAIRAGDFDARIYATFFKR